jgi:hypothetical protein
MLSHRDSSTQSAPAKPATPSPPATMSSDPVTTVLSRMPTGKADVGIFLITFPAAFVAADIVAPLVGLPPPFTTAALVAAAAVGIKNTVQSRISTTKQTPVSSPELELKERTDSFAQTLERHAQRCRASMEEASLESKDQEEEVYKGRLNYVEGYRAYLFGERQYWDQGLATNEEWATTLDGLISKYRLGTRGWWGPTDSDLERLREQTIPTMPPGWSPPIQ